MIHVHVALILQKHLLFLFLPVELIFESGLILLLLFGVIKCIPIFDFGLGRFDSMVQLSPRLKVMLRLD